MGRYDNILFGLSDNILETLRREDIEPGFAEVIPYLKSIRADLQLFENQGDFRIPDSRINNVDQAVNQIQNGINRIIEFKPMGMNNPQGERQGILETMKQLSDLVAENFRPYIRPDFSELETRRAQVVALQEDLAGRIVDARQTTAAADKALKDAESLVAELRSGAVAKASEEISGYYKKATN